MCVFYVLCCVVLARFDLFSCVFACLLAGWLAWPGCLAWPGAGAARGAQGQGSTGDPVRPLAGLESTSWQAYVRALARL